MSKIYGYVVESTKREQIEVYANSKDEADKLFDMYYTDCEDIGLLLRFHEEEENGKEIVDKYEVQE